MHFHVVLTTDCNLKCSYCYGKSCREMELDWNQKENIDYDVPAEPEWTVGELKAFIEKDPESWVSFYGGEPTMRPDLIRNIMDAVRCRGFLMQTNGTLLDKLEPEYCNRFDTILLSIGGTRETTDRNRGTGVYDTVMAARKRLLDNGFRGELIARMVIEPGTNAEANVRHLVDSGFKSVHWQLDANFWKCDAPETGSGFMDWVRNSYNPSIKRLADWWVSLMDTGTVLRLYPFLGITEDLLDGRKTPGIRCGAGWSNYAILTDGNIAPCPVMQGMKDYYTGNIKTSDPKRLPKTGLDEPCVSCRILGECGGRCLYADKTKLWGPDGFRQVCTTVEFLVKTLKEKLPDIRKLLDSGTIPSDSFRYHRYNGCEIIP